MAMQIGSISTTGNAGDKDAFHVPGVLVTCRHMVKPGQSVKFVDNDFTSVVAATVKDRHAIVDPFIEPPSVGDKFWVLLIPNLTANLSHHFEVLVSDLPIGPINQEKEDERRDLQRKLADYEVYQDEDDGCRGCW